jgi:hypothetical protein
LWLLANLALIAPSGFLSFLLRIARSLLALTVRVARGGSADA